MDKCNICDGELQALPDYSALPRVSSDCKPLQPGGMLAACRSCGGMQKPITMEFMADIGRIYANYDVYYQGGGIEQIVHDSRHGRPVRRSDVLTERLVATGLLPDRGRAIDLGCGNGTFLAAFANRFPDWTLHGLELDRKHEATLAAIPGFAGLVVGEPEKLTGTYDFISMIHALEHFTDPSRSLRAMRERLSPDGLLFIEMPNAAQNPFDFVIADHVSHMTPWGLEKMLGAAGLAVVHLATDWVSKELSVIARAVERPPLPTRIQTRADIASSAIGWLTQILRVAEGAAVGTQPFGLFGTSIAATWLTAALGDRVIFYLDEDESRQGRSFFGKPILAPRDAPPGSTVFVGLAPIIATVVARRLEAYGIKVVMPPDFAGGNHFHVVAEPNRTTP